MKLLSCSKGCGGTKYVENHIEEAVCDPCNGILNVRPLEGDALRAFEAEQEAKTKKEEKAEKGPAKK